MKTLNARSFNVKTRPNKKKLNRFEQTKPNVLNWSTDYCRFDKPCSVTDEVEEERKKESCNLISSRPTTMMNANCLFAPSPPPRLFPLRSIPSVSPSGYRRTGVSEDVAVECRNLCFSATTRPGISVPILRDCSFRIPSGQLWMLLGPNGCGKSTLLKILAGVVNPTSGNVFVEKPKNFVFQNPDHQVVMPTVEADVAFGLGKYPDMSQEEVKSRVITALDAVGMRDYMQRPIQTLSGGQKQRVAIAGALAEACKVLLLDELTTFLDESDQLGVIKAVKELINAKKGGDVTALWVTHRLEELEYADGAVYMENGRVVRHGDAATVLDFIKAKQSSYIDQIGF